MSGWIWVSQTLRRTRIPWTHPCLLIRISVVWLFTFICTQFCSIFRLKKLFEMWVIHVGEELTCRKLSFLSILCFVIVRKRSQEKGFILRFMNRNLFSCGFWHGVCYLFAPMQWNRKVCFCHWLQICCLFRWGKDRKGILEVLWVYHNKLIMFESCVIFELNKFAYVGWNLLCKQLS